MLNLINKCLKSHTKEHFGITDKESALFELREEMDRLENEGKMDSDEYRWLKEQWLELNKPQLARW